MSFLLSGFSASCAGGEKTQAMFTGLKSGSAACLSACMLLNSAWYSMASLMDAVAKMALKWRPPVAASCLARMASIDLLHNSRFELEVVNASDQVEAQAEAFAAISIALRNNFKAFESTDDVFV